MRGIECYAHERAERRDIEVEKACKCDLRGHGILHLSLSDARVLLTEPKVARAARNASNSFFHVVARASAAVQSLAFALELSLKSGSRVEAS